VTAPEIDAVADELYGLPADEFIGARTAHAKQAKADGDRELATQIQALKKPTVAAWLVNQLARTHHDELAVLVDLGAEMRQGLTGISADEMRELTKRRFQLVASLVKRAGEIAAEAGHGVGADASAAVQATLEATLSDQASADAVVAGRLTEPLAVSGFGFGSPFGAVDARPGGDVVDLGAHREKKTKKVERAEADVAAAEKTARLAHERVDDTRARLDVAARQHDEALTQVEQLSKQLQQAETELERRANAFEKLTATREDAEEAAVEADEEVHAARRRLDELTR
jgi:DNA repair exonuclease SbcCD ATPase subunit